jgi:hypothetical protein
VGKGNHATQTKQQGQQAKWISSHEHIVERYLLRAERLPDFSMYKDVSAKMVTHGKNSKRAGSCTPTVLTVLQEHCMHALEIRQIEKDCSSVSNARRKCKHKHKHERTGHTVEPGITTRQLKMEQC